MEGANEAARRAVNGLLDAVKFDGARCELWPLHEPEILAAMAAARRGAIRRPACRGTIHSMQVAAHAIRGASPLLEQARPLLEAVAPFVNPVADALDSTRSALSRRASMRCDPATDPAPPDAVPSRYALTRCRALPASAGDVVGPTGFLERLGWYRDMLADTLAAGVPTWEPQRHLYGLVRDFIDRSGKGLRPALCIATARALGGRARGCASRRRRPGNAAQRISRARRH